MDLADYTNHTRNSIRSFKRELSSSSFSAVFGVSFPFDSRNKHGVQNQSNVVYRPGTKGMNIDLNAGKLDIFLKNGL